MAQHDTSLRGLPFPLTGAAIYALFGVLWIYFSDTLLGMLTDDPERLTTLQTYKGWFFILITAILVFLLLRRHSRHMQASINHLRQSEASLDFLFQALPIGVGTAKNRVMVSANDRLCEMSGFTREELIGQETRNFYLDDAEYERVGRAIFEATETGRAYLETQWKDKHGNVRDIQLGTAVTFGGTGPMDFVFSAMDVTEQREQQALYRLVFESAHDALFLMDGPTFVDCNESALKIYGLTREQFLGTTPMDHSPALQPDGQDSERAARRLIDAALAGTPQRFEWRHLRGDGSPFDAEVSLNRIPLGGKQYLLVTFRDITERKKREAARRKSEEYLSTIFRTVPTGIGVTSDRVLVTVNDRFCEIFGYERDELLGSGTRQLYVSEDEYLKCGESIYGQLEEYGVSSVECRMVKKDGTEVHVLVHSSSLSSDDDGQTVISSILDITERKQTLEALHASEDYLASIFSTVPIGIGVVSNRSLETVNDRFCEIYGYTREELLGDGTRKLYVSEEEFQRCGKGIYDQLDSMGRSSVEAHMVRKDGREVHIRIDSTRLSRAGNNNTVISSVLDITALKQAEERLRASEERFKALHNASFGGIAIHDKGVILDCNQGLSDITGYTLDELTGMDGLLLIAEQSRKLVMDNIKSGYEEPYEAMGVRKNGEEYPLRLEGRMIPYQGKTIRVVEFRDITEPKRAEARLRDSERLLKEAQRVAKLGHWVLDIPKNTLDWSDEVFRIFGLEPKAFAATFEAFLERVHPEDRDLLATTYNTSVKEHSPYAIDHRVISPDGSIRFVHEQGETHYDEQGNALLSIGIILDITERNKALQALRDNEEYLATVFRIAPTGIAVVKDRAFQSVNERFAEIFGYTPEELIGKNTRLIYNSDEEYTRYGQAYYEALENTGTCSLEAHGVRKTGEEIFLLVNASPLTRSGQEGLTTFSVLDITDLKRTEQELRAHKEKLEEMVRERTAELTASNTELQRMMAESENRSAQAVILNEMGELLQACETEEETYRVAGGVCAKLFPDDAGCIGILEEESWNIRIVGAWGQDHQCTAEFAHNDCWAIRRGKAHTVLASDMVPLCDHVKEPPQCGTLCLPMAAQGRVLGMTHLRFGGDPENLSEQEQLNMVNEKRQLLSGMVERYAPSLVNLRLRETLREQSIRDRLTGLFNRRHMEEALFRELARAKRRGTPLGVVMIDVDHFKRFNDTYGHEIGDLVLRELGKFLITSVRAEDIACRFGGEELLLILPDSNFKDTLARAEGIRRGIEKDVTAFHGGDTLHVTASLGVAAFPLHGEDADSLLGAADMALYQAKKRGRNQVAGYER